MRWAVFAVFAVIGLVFDAGLAEVFRIEKLWHVRPSLCVVIAVFVALSAPRAAAMWACFVLGLLLDLSHRLTTPGSQVVYLVGPYTLGYLAGGWIVIRGRSMVFRRRALTLGVMTLVALAVIHAVAVTVYAVRSAAWYPGGPIYWTDASALHEVLRRLLIAIYSGLFAIPAGWLLVRSMPLWGFQTGAHRAPTIR